MHWTKKLSPNFGVGRRRKEDQQRMTHTNFGPRCVCVENCSPSKRGRGLKVKVINSRLKKKAKGRKERRGERKERKRLGLKIFHHSSTDLQSRSTFYCYFSMGKRAISLHSFVLCLFLGFIPIVSLTAKYIRLIVINRLIEWMNPWGNPREPPVSKECQSSNVFHSFSEIWIRRRTTRYFGSVKTPNIYWQRDKWKKPSLSFHLFNLLSYSVESSFLSKNLIPVTFHDNFFPCSGITQLTFGVGDDSRQS